MAGFIETMPLETLFAVDGRRRWSARRSIMVAADQAGLAPDRRGASEAGWRSRTTARSATSRSRPSRPATSRARSPGRPQAAVLLRAEAPRQPPALRLPPRAQRRAAVVGGAEGPVARPHDQAPGDARRGSPGRVRRVRGRDSVRLRRRHRHAVGPRHVDARGGRRRRGAEEGRPEVHARRLQAEGIVGAGAHQGLGQPGAARRTTAARGC